ncbi:hypothetical protein XENTR_v10021591 [Xenopus tropicalis]|nr:hypothetical protein XENTR_v10021591 [Xenopus tropicalis]
MYCLHYLNAGQIIHLEHCLRVYSASYNKLPRENPNTFIKTKAKQIVGYWQLSLIYMQKTSTFVGFNVIIAYSFIPSEFAVLYVHFK